MPAFWITSPHCREKLNAPFGEKSPRNRWVCLGFCCVFRPEIHRRAWNRLIACILQIIGLTRHWQKKHSHKCDVGDFDAIDASGSVTQELSRVVINKQCKLCHGTSWHKRGGGGVVKTYHSVHVVCDLHSEAKEAKQRKKTKKRYASWSPLTWPVPVSRSFRLHF